MIDLIKIANYEVIQVVLRLALSALLFLLIWILLDTLGFQNPRRIEGILDFPGYPIVGNVFRAMKSPSRVYMNWAKQYNAPIFQVRLGIKRVVVVHGFSDVNKLWVGSSSATNSRPMSYTFHGVVSKTQGFTIGSTPYCDSFKRMKKVISMHLNKRSVDEMNQIIDQESRYMIKNIIMSSNELQGPPSCNFYRNFRYEQADIDLKPFAQLFALRSSVYIAYGVHLDCYNRDREFCKEIIEVESQIMRFRSISFNLRDYLPFLRYIPSWGSGTPDHYRQRRDNYMGELYKAMKLKTVNGTRSTIPDVPCRYTKNTDTEGYIGLVTRVENPQELKKVTLTKSEIQSLCLTMVSAGLDNTPLTFNHLMGHLSQPYGDKLQKRAFSELMALSGDNIVTCWETSSENTECDYVMALVYEALRFFSVLPLGLPRVTTKDILYYNVKIPAGTTLVMNTFAANHDKTYFKNPYQFLPERWLDKGGKLVAKTTLNHLSFGIGSRMCSGNHLALKELYTLTCRMILLFKIKSPTGNTLMKLDPFVDNLYEDGTSFEPKPFKVRLEPRTWNESDKLYFKVMRS